MPPNTTVWLQPCDVLLIGLALQKVHKQHKLDRQPDVPPTLQRTCEQFSDALNAASNSTPEQLRHNSSTNTIKRTQSLFTSHNSSQP